MPAVRRGLGHGLVFLVPLSEIAGVGPVARWAWAEFAATDSTGTRVLIIVTMAAATAAVLWVVYRLGAALTWRRYQALIEEGDDQEQQALGGRLGGCG